MVNQQQHDGSFHGNGVFRFLRHILGWWGRRRRRNQLTEALIREHNNEMPPAQHAPGPTLADRWNAVVNDPFHPRHFPKDQFFCSYALSYQDVSFSSGKTEEEPAIFELDL